MSSHAKLKMIASNFALSTDGKMPGQLGAPTQLRVRVSGEDVSDGSVAISWEPQDAAELDNGTSTRKLPSGSFTEEIEWNLIHKVRGDLFVSIQAFAGRHPQRIEVCVHVTEAGGKQ